MGNRRSFLFALILTLGSVQFAFSGTAGNEKIPVLIIDGQNNHDWERTSPFLAYLLESTGRFKVDRATTPPRGAPPEAWENFAPDFSRYRVVVINYNGQTWPERVRKAFEQYVANGGGVVVVHAGNNPFADWPEYNRMIGLGWRNNRFGWRVYVDDEGKVHRVPPGQGPGAGHGRQHEYVVEIRDPSHPVTKGLPKRWLHARDELYHGQRGPAENMHILATAYDDPSVGGTGVHEPLVWWIPYGKGKVFTILLGHVGRGQKDLAGMQCVGFATLFRRACEWVATGKVTIPVPPDFPTENRVSLIPLPERG